MTTFADTLRSLTQQTIYDYNKRIDDNIENFFNFIIKDIKSNMIYEAKQGRYGYNFFSCDKGSILLGQENRVFNRKDMNNIIKSDKFLNLFNEFTKQPDNIGMTFYYENTDELIRFYVSWR